MTVDDAGLEIAKYLGIPNYQNVQLDGLSEMHSFKSPRKEDPTYFVAKFSRFWETKPEAEELAKAYIGGKKHYVKHMTDDVPLFE